VSRRVVVIGAGPAGLVAGRELTRLGVPVVVLEKGDDVGGLARNGRLQGLPLRLGGHRFFTKAEPVERMWHEVLGRDLAAPAATLHASTTAAASSLTRCGRGTRSPGSAPWRQRDRRELLRWQFRPHATEETFEQWVTNVSAAPV